LDTDSVKSRAAAAFKKEERQRDGKQATAEYEANQRAVREKTEKLRALRLARDAALSNSKSVPAGNRK